LVGLPVSNSAPRAAARERSHRLRLPRRWLAEWAAAAFEADFEIKLGGEVDRSDSARHVVEHLNKAEHLSAGVWSTLMRPALASWPARLAAHLARSDARRSQGCDLPRARACTKSINGAESLMVSWASIERSINFDSLRMLPRRNAPKRLAAQRTAPVARSMATKTRSNADLLGTQANVRCLPASVTLKHHARDGRHRAAPRPPPL
jgi:hypothetical protein